MLTPVAASSDTSFSAYGQPGTVLSAQRGDVLLSSTSVDPRMLREPSVSSGSRLDLLSLSGQLQLAQGLSVVETIGALLSVSRNQGEPLTDYADRIAEVIAKLSPTERLSLQRALNQLMQGFTLRLLTEILKNPVGPDATRLALKLEAAAYLERDPVTRQVVTSYRQNAGAEAQPPTSGRPAAGGAIAGASARQTAPPFDGAMGASPAETRDDAKQSVLRQNSDETEREGEARTSARPSAPLTLLNSRTSAQLGIPVAPAPANTLAAGADLLGQAATLSLTDPEETGLPQAVATTPETKAPAELRPDAQNAADAALDDVTYDGPALARLVQAGGEPPIASAATRAASASQQPVQPASASMPGAVLTTLPEPESVTVAWISGFYADEGGASWLLANAAPQAMADAADPLAAHGFDGMAASGDEGLPDSLGAVPGTASTPLPAAAAQNTGAPTSAATLNPAQQAAALQALAAQGLLVRDGLMPAYVPYPAPGGIEEKPKPLVPAVEPDDEHRERGRRSGGDPGTGEDGQDEQRAAETETTMAGDGDVMQELALFDERAAEQDIAHLATAPASGDDAQTYYQRMAGW